MFDLLFPEYFAVAVADLDNFFEASLESPTQKFDEGLPRCFQFWFMLEVKKMQIYSRFEFQEEKML